MMCLSENCIAPPLRKVFNRANRVGTGNGKGLPFPVGRSHSRRQSRERGLASVSTRRAAFATYRRPVALRAHYGYARVLKNVFPGFALFIPALPSANGKAVPGASACTAGNNAIVSPGHTAAF